MRERKFLDGKKGDRYGTDACACTRGSRFNYAFHLSDAFPLRKTISRHCYIRGEPREHSPRAKDTEASVKRRERERKRRERGVSGIESARSGGACAINDEADKTRDKQNSILRSKTFVKFINCNIAAGSPSALLGTSLSKTNRKSMDR